MEILVLLIIKGILIKEYINYNKKTKFFINTRIKTGLEINITIKEYDF